MRILIATPGAGDPRGGAGQLALGLATGLRRLGHEVEAFDPARDLAPASPWRLRGVVLRRIAARAQGAGPFDLVDLPPTLVPPRLPTGARRIVRSVQPELRYLAIERRSALRRFGRAPWRSALCLALVALRGAWVRRGWRAGHALFCLGSGELDWMRRHFGGSPTWLRRYDAAPSDQDRAALVKVRSSRAPERPKRGGTAFLWIGRWSSHKGTDALVRFTNARLGARPADTLTVAGCGRVEVSQWRPELRQRVRIVPAFERHELPALLAAHDAGLFTSLAEGWGLSLQEMLESGLSVFATREGAVADLQPYFGAALRPFPPSLEAEPTGGRAPGPGYDERFDWTAIARRYLDAIAESAGVEGR